MDTKRFSSLPKWLPIVLCALLITTLGIASNLAQAKSSESGSVTPGVFRDGTAPQAPASFSSYLPFISKGSAGLTISDVKVIQGTSASSTYAVYIADRATTVRVFAATGDGSSVSGVTARMYGYDASGTALGSLSPANSSITTPSSESSMGTTLNFSLPSSWLKPGYSYSIDLISSSASARYPASGTRPFNFVSVQPLNVVVVPIAYKPFDSTTTYYPDTSDLSYLTSMPIKVYPVPSINYTTHALYNYTPSSATQNLDYSTGAGWSNLLSVITSLHFSEDPGGSKIYYGLVNSYDAHGCSSGCMAGIGWYGLPTSVGWSGLGAGESRATKTFTHEMGHNFNRWHARCTGTEADVDPSYPYLGGLIGVWGLDVAASTLYNPSVYADFMGYCSLVWTSDYTFAGIKSFRDSHSYGVNVSRQRTQAIYLSGIIAPTGEVTLRPIYQQLAPVSNATEGSHAIELLGTDGTVLAAHSFDPIPIADLDGFSGFGFFVPAVEGLAGIRVKRGNQVMADRRVDAQPIAVDFTRQDLAVQADARGTVLRWGTVAPGDPRKQMVYRLRLSRDGGETWQVLGLDWTEPQFTVPPGLDLNNTLLEVQASDGIHVITRTFKVGK